ncbi:PREDICTED: uncharacterized protein LOC104817035 isoform X2 [Tarenaya hassleriana]|uniref:uncharacterized protein LOC104817035 isoform X2 n=1 Tax=Tarenaya hassleriana TaxID=28532 RepID=UPI00053CA64D|nr:PREDICTED: uncharacterized protein LOC104817035 isoform X2 [Tarenaya hassleriana]
MMSVDDKQQFGTDSLDETSDGSRKKPRISYKREFLLSLSSVCKKLPKLPSGFDKSLLRDSEDPLPERRRISGDFSSHGFRRNDSSSSPPARGELGSYSRGAHGRWEGRSGGWNDKDSDSQFDRDSEPGRRYGMPSRGPWQASEHDGLLGKGSFPRPSGYGAGRSGPRSQSNDLHQLNRSNGPYHPPPPYKAKPYSRRDTKDSFNDETFGPSDSASEDRAEEEKKRRASFELLRKEQHKTFQEKQNLNPEGRKNDFDFTVLPGDSKEENGQQDTSKQVREFSTLPDSNNTVAPLQNTTPTPKPLVPPGFGSTLLKRKQEAQPPTGVSQHEDSLLKSKEGHLLNGTPGNNEENTLLNQTGSNELLMQSTDVNISTNTSERAVDLSTVFGITADIVGKDKNFEKHSHISSVTEAPEYSEQSEQAMTKLDQKRSLGNSDGPSILDKLFNTDLNLNSGDSSNVIEHRADKVEEILSPQTVKSSKFAYLFHEEDGKPPEDISSSEQPNGLLSLLQGANKSQTFDVKSKDELSARLLFQGCDTKIPDQLSNTSPSKSAAVPPVLTCEDLEQSILSEVSDSYSPPPPAIQDSDVSSVRTKQQKTDVDDQASQHLLSLLQKGAGAGPENQAVQPMSKTESRPPPTEKPPKTGGICREADTGKTLTLETLFGSAFMKELQSVGEPVSAKAGVSEGHGSPLPIKSEDLLLVGAQLRLDGITNELSQRDQMSSDVVRGGLIPNADNQTGLGPRISNVKSQIELMASVSVHQDSPPYQQFPANMIRPPFHHTPGGVPEFDRLPHPILQQMQMPMRGKMPHHSILLQGFANGPPHHHPHAKNQMSGVVPAELNTSQGLPLAHRQPNFAGHNMPPPVREVNGSDQPVSLQRLLGIGPKQISPMGQAIDLHHRGSFGHDLNMSFGYR